MLSFRISFIEKYYFHFKCNIVELKTPLHDIKIIFNLNSPKIK
jgi:hypothetical protein